MPQNLYTNVWAGEKPAPDAMSGCVARPNRSGDPSLGIMVDGRRWPVISNAKWAVTENGMQDRIHRNHERAVAARSHLSSPVHRRDSGDVPIGAEKSGDGIGIDGPARMPA